MSVIGDTDLGNVLYSAEEFLVDETIGENN